MVCSNLFRPVWRTLSILCLPLLCVLAACGEETAGGAGQLRVVATTGQAADFARAVGGERVRVTGLIAPNADPHEFEIRPDDVGELSDAKLVVRSGGDLDEWLDGAIESSGADAQVLTLADHVEQRDDDPHWWQDPRNAVAAVAALRDALIEADPGGAGAYRHNAAAYTRRLERLDRAVAACIGKLPAADRTLVTTHDALGYYADRYGIRVVGAVIPSRSTAAQPSAGEITELVETIRRERVKAVFAESSVKPDVEEAIARESGARVGRALWADTLGPEGSDGATYVDSIASNTAALVDGFSGGEVACRPEA
jgi:zinc/manganese transport system substrate-binding protein/manganese/iron transport system substrate-binding protein